LIRFHVTQFAEGKFSQNEEEEEVKNGEQCGPRQLINQSISRITKQEQIDNEFWQQSHATALSLIPFWLDRVF
jgi:hypothetical protein